ncbi:MAG TPA: nucleotidyltransferase family protein [Elusimicrobiota bacterium]|nr:nucleotidyltransferase family protein [Elusimicrobiota bacterium]
MLVGAVILAAGHSERMGRPKALLEWEGDTFLGTIGRRLRRAGVSEVSVVLGRDAETILKGWRRANERVLINRRPEDGQISSLKLALRELAVDPAPEAVLVCLADTPLVRVETYARLISAWAGSQGCLVVPRFNGKRGHPLVLDHRFWHETQLAPLEQGLHWVTHRHPESLRDVDVDDGGVTADIDTPGDYQKALSPAGR